MEDNKKSPELRFEGFTDHWKDKKLNVIADIIGGGTPSTLVSEYWNGDIDWYSPTEIGNEVYAKGSVNKITVEGYENSSAKMLPPNKTILFTSRAGIGDMAILQKEGCTNQGFQSLVLNNGYDPYFIYSAGHLIKKYALSKASGSTFLEISNKILGEMELAVPKSENEQQQIGSFFKNIDELITKHQNKHKRLVTLKKSMLEKMFPKEGQSVPEIRFQGFSGVWESDALNNFGSTYTGLSGKTKKDFGHGNAKYITYMNVFSNSIANPALTDSVEIDNSQNCVEYGDVFFTVSSETPEEVGFSSVWTQDEKNTYLNSFCFGYRPTKKFGVTFLANALRSSAFRKKITLLGQGISRFNISKTKVMCLELSFPTYNEQVKIGLYFNDLDRLIKSHQKQLQKLNNFKQSLSEKMFV